jgi:4-amino-4-deoxy-L-arabinose transferase-like glycosyltransferase
MPARLAIALLLLAAGAVRLWSLSLIEFKADEANWLTLAEDFVRHGQFPLAGLRSSQGITAPPHFAYILAPLVAISREPEFATAAIVLANVAGIAGVCWLGWRASGPVAAVVTAFLYAVNPGAVFWSRKVWQPDLTAPLAVLLFVALDLGVVQRRLRWAAAAVPIGVFATLVHLSFALLLPLLAAPVLVLLRARRWRLLAIASGMVALLTLPSVVYEQQVGWEDYKDFRYFQSQRSATNLVGLGYALELVTGWEARTLVNVPIRAFTWPPLENAASALAVALLVFAIAVAIVRAVRPSSGAERARLLLWLAWLALPILLTVRHNMLLYPHYYLLLMPAAFLLIGSAAQWLAERRPLLIGVLATVGVVGVFQSVIMAQFFGYLESTNPSCFYGVPLGRTREMANDVLGLARQTHSPRLSLETGETEVGYLLRPDFGRIDAPDVRFAPLRAAAPSAATAQPGVHVLDARVDQLSVPDGRARLAIAWQVGSDIPPETSVRWQAMLGDASLGAAETGVAHKVGDLQGQPVVSLLTLGPPRGGNATPATYPVRVGLLDEATSRPMELTLPDGSRAADWQVASVTAYSSPRCEPEESAL